MGATEPPRLAASDVIEGHALRAHRIPGDPEPGFAGFLDGTQQSRVVHYHDGVPLVHATVAAVIRFRNERRLYTWTGRPDIERALYVPRNAVPEALWDHLVGEFGAVVDTTPRDDAGLERVHPFIHLERAMHTVQERREALEEALAARWCERERRPILVDGGIYRSDVVARSPWAVGVVKSHRTLYAEGDALARVLQLRRGERSSVVRVSRASGYRAPVASWYLRLRDPAGRDPMWGLVRVEAADPTTLSESAEQLTARADQVSRWVLAEVAPLALPDARWDKMVYPIRDCEEYLRAVG